MAYPISLQARELVCAILLGWTLGIHYDLLWGLRRLAAGLTVPLDLWFGVSTMCGCWLFALYIGRGCFHWSMILGLLGGSLLYFLTFSPLLRRFLRCCWFSL